MSNFKRFVSSDNTDNYDSGYVGREGELTWDSSNGLRLHDGYTSGGNSVGGGSVPSGPGAIHTLAFGGGTSANNGKVLIQNVNIESEWGYPDRVDNADNAINLDDQASVSWGDRSGMVVVTDHWAGYTYTWIVGGGGVTLLGSTGGGSATCSMTFNGGYTLTNTSGTNRNFGVAWIVTRHNT